MQPLISTRWQGLQHQQQSRLRAFLYHLGLILRLLSVALVVFLEKKQLLLAIWHVAIECLKANTNGLVRIQLKPKQSCACMVWLFSNKPPRQPTNRPISQPINQASNQASKQPSKQQLTNQPTKQPINQLVSTILNLTNYFPHEKGKLESESYNLHSRNTPIRILIHGQ